MIPLPSVVDAAVAGFSLGLYDLLLRGVETATGPAGLVIIWLSSCRIAFVLPLPSEVGLLAPLDLGLPAGGRLVVIKLVSGLGKATGSVVAFHIGQELKSAGPVLRCFERRGYDVRA